MAKRPSGLHSQGRRRWTRSLISAIIRPVFPTITIVHSSAGENEAGKGLWACYLSTREGGDAVMLCHNPDSQLHHFGNARFGSDYGGEQFAMARTLPSGAFKRMLIANPYHAKIDTEYFAQKDKAVIFKAWDDALAELKKEHGDGTKVAVYPYTSIQCPPFPEDR